jgi:hypothetical protein
VAGVTALRRWTERELRAFAGFCVGGFVVSVLGAAALFSSIDDRTDSCVRATGSVGTIQPASWAIIAVVLVAITMLGSWLRPPVWPLWVGLALGTNLWLYSIALTLDGC